MSVSVANYTVAGTFAVTGATALSAPLTSSSSAAFTTISTTNVTTTACNTTTLNVGGASVIGGSTTFSNILPTCSIVPTTASQLVNKAYVDGVSVLATSNVWTGASNTFGLVNVGTLNATGTSTFGIVNVGTLNATGSTTFNSSLPTSTLTPSASTQLVTKTYTDSAITSQITTLKSASNTFSGSNTYSGVSSFTNTLALNDNKIYFRSAGDAVHYIGYSATIDGIAIGGYNGAVIGTYANPNAFKVNTSLEVNIPATFSSLPACGAIPSTANQLVNKTYADTIKPALLAGTNAWTGTNTFNSSLPTSTLTPSASTQLVTKTYADSLITTLKSSVNNWTSVSNQFLNLYATYFNVGSIDCTTTVAAGSIAVTGDSNLTRAHGLKGFYSNTNHEPGSRFISPTYIRLTTGPGAWLCNGGGGAFPVLGSVSALLAYSALDVEDSVLVMPGFKLVLYINDSYTGQSATFDNTQGSVVRYYNMNISNAASSCKLFYLDQNTSNLNEMGGPYNGGTISYV